jgi:hypothetical protein
MGKQRNRISPTPNGFDSDGCAILVATILLVFSFTILMLIFI